MSIELRVAVNENLMPPIKTAGTVVELGRDFGDTPAGHQFTLVGDKSVSRKHARIQFHDGTYTITDLGSRFGTHLNAQKLPPNVEHIITPGDVIRLGDKTEIELIVPVGDEGLGFIRDEIPANAGLDALAQTGFIASNLRKYLSALQRISVHLSGATHMEALLATIVQQVQQTITDAGYCGVQVLDENGQLPLATDGALLEARHSWPPDTANKGSKTLAEYAINQQTVFVWESQGDPSESVQRHNIRSAIYAPLIWEADCYGVLYIINTEYENAFGADETHMLQVLAQQSAMFIKNQRLQDDLRREAVIRDRLLVHFSPQVVDQLMAQQVQLGGNYKEDATVLVSDIRGFTVMSNQMAPGDVMDMLNEMFGLLAPIIHAHQGAIDKYIGDAIMAVFGSPQDDDDQCLHAVQAAVAMQRALREAAPRLRERFGQVPEIGIGIHTGPLVHGFLGAEERLEYTVIGDTVNMANRLCDKVPRGDVYITAATYACVRADIEVDPEAIIVQSAKHADREPSQTVYRVRF